MANQIAAMAASNTELVNYYIDELALLQRKYDHECQNHQTMTYVWNTQYDITQTVVAARDKLAQDLAQSQQQCNALQTLSLIHI